MRVIADLHIHSKYARACSKDLTPQNLALWGRKKGISVIGTGDFTHPGWFAELSESLTETKPGLYQLKTDPTSPYFMLTAEVASIYKQGDAVRRIHNLLFAPNLAAVEKLNKTLADRGANLKSDGRPIFGIHCDDLLDICKEVDPAIELIPAHAWTPHFGVFGSLSGFNSLEEAYGRMTKYIFAIETGLSSDPAMNWQVGAFDSISLISNSDAHSLRKLGREANVLEISETELSYQTIIETIRAKNPQSFLYTIEFFPEEGKYHLDGHRAHGYSCLPEETDRHNGLCPVCGKKLLRGVLHRVNQLASRPLGNKPSSTSTIPFQNVIPLEEIIAETLGVGVASKKVLAQYEQLVDKRPEFAILLESNREELEALAGPSLAESIMRVREGRVHIKAGYDGVFGTIHIYSEQERAALFKKPTQTVLF